MLTAAQTFPCCHAGFAFSLSKKNNLLIAFPREGGGPHSGGGAYVRLLRPHFSASLSPKDPIFFSSKLGAVTESPHFETQFEILSLK